jgi:hypothetical protein
LKLTTENDYRQAIIKKKIAQNSNPKMVTAERTQKREMGMND